jgi:hypothetical protein
VQSQEGMVGFSDDFGTLLRIDYYLIPAEQIQEIESMDEEQYFQSILLDKYIPQAIVSNLPSSTVDYTEYIEDENQGGGYFALVNMPGGSTISKQENNGHPQRLDAYRGLLAFMEGEFIYIVSSQRNFFDREKPGSIEIEAEAMKTNILNFIDTIEFN